jgi:hypothetical protein
MGTKGGIMLIVGQIHPADIRPPLANGMAFFTCTTHGDQLGG